MDTVRNSHTRRKGAAGQKAGLAKRGIFSAATWQVIADCVSFTTTFLQKIHRSLRSKSNPPHWASIWFLVQICSRCLFFAAAVQKEGHPKGCPFLGFRGPPPPLSFKCPGEVNPPRAEVLPAAKPCSARRGPSLLSSPSSAKRSVCPAASLLPAALARSRLSQGPT